MTATFTVGRHDLRRTLGSWMAAQGVNLSIIGKALGHKSLSTTTRYARLNLDPIRHASNAVAAALLGHSAAGPEGRQDGVGKAEYAAHRALALRISSTPEIGFYPNRDQSTRPMAGEIRHGSLVAFSVLFMGRSASLSATRDGAARKPPLVGTTMANARCPAIQHRRPRLFQPAASTPLNETAGGTTFLRDRGLTALAPTGVFSP